MTKTGGPKKLMTFFLVIDHFSRMGGQNFPRGPCPLAPPLAPALVNSMFGNLSESKEQYYGIHPWLILHNYCDLATALANVVTAALICFVLNER